MINSRCFVLPVSLKPTTSAVVNGGMKERLAPAVADAMRISSPLPSSLMDFVQAFRRGLSVCIPHPIEPDWNPSHALRLAEFPVNISCAPCADRWDPEYAAHHFDPNTFAENSELPRMRYYPRGTRLRSGSRWSSARSAGVSTPGTAEKDWCLLRLVLIFRGN
jgi:hypothetical protein